MSGLSGRYRFVPTAEIIAGLRDKDWVPVSAEQQRPRLLCRWGFQKHLIRFRRREQMQTLDEWNVELVLTNSHDAACAYVLQVGVYRRLCSNGLVISDEGFEAIRFRHAGLDAQQVVGASFQIMEHAPKVAGLIDRLRRRTLSPLEARMFASQALLLRYESEDGAPVRAESLLTARRPEDDRSDLWTTLNRVQENLIRGGLSDGLHDRHGRLRTMRSLRGIDSKVTLNQRLWRLAETTASAHN